MTSSTHDPLVSTEWLAAHLDDPGVRIVDASFKLPGVTPLPRDDYLRAHIPGAVFFDVDAVSDHENPVTAPATREIGQEPTDSVNRLLPALTAKFTHENTPLS